MPSIWDSTWLVIDTETTGVDVETACVVELGFVPFFRGLPGSRYGRLLNPGIPIPEQASSIHGITDAHVADCPTLDEVADRFLEHVRQSEVLVGYNLYGYDAPVLSRRLGDRWKKAVAGIPQIDPLVLVRTPGVGRFWKGAGRHRLKEVAARLGVAMEGAAHRATADCLMTGRILWKLRDNKSVAKLPTDPVRLERELRELKAQQDEDFAAWQRSQRA